MVPGAVMGSTTPIVPEAVSTIPPLENGRQMKSAPHRTLVWFCWRTPQDQHTGAGTQGLIPRGSIASAEGVQGTKRFMPGSARESQQPERLVPL